MKIAMFTDYFFPELGGIQDSVATLSRALGKRGHHVDIYAPRYGRQDYHRIGQPLREPDLGPNVRVRRRTSLPFPSSTRQSRAALPLPVAPPLLPRGGRPDILHVHSFFGLGLEALLNAAVLSIPVIGTNHTTIAGFAPYIPISAGRAGAYVGWFYSRCDYVTAPSQSVFAELAPTKARRPQRVISNPIDTGLFRPAEAADRDLARARFGLAGPTITYAGRLAPEKNIEVMLHALARLQADGVKADLTIAGHGSHEPILRRLAVELRIDRRVRFVGTLRQDDLAQLMRASEAFTIMSTSETQSMVLLQAMACGIPVVAADSRALPEFVGPSNGVLVDPHDPEALAVAWRGMLEAPARLRALGRSGRTTAERYGIGIVTDEWESLYRSVLQGSSAE